MKRKQINLNQLVLAYELGDDAFYDIASLVHDFSLVIIDNNGVIKPVSNREK
ncbi:MAG: hypothetical protein LBJ73_04870 [Rickettsiales bacterium]|jgi:hypothetical protein|nr:hypothetical protein [Rickettsiales bacterium]